MNFARKDLISLKDLSKDEILSILDTAETMKYICGNKNKKAPHLAGKSVITLFYEMSTRTRLSFDLAAQYLGASIVNMEISLDSNQSGSLIDMGKIIDQMGGDFTIIKHPMSGSAMLLSEHTKSSVINAGDGINENPTQSLINFMAIKKSKGTFEGLKICIVGDITKSKSAKSNLWGLIKLGAEITVVGPTTLIPSDISFFGVRVLYSLKEAIRDSDVIIVSKMRDEKDFGSLFPSLNEYRNLYKIDENVLRFAKKDAIIMHPGPINRGIEISAEVIDANHCLVDDQIANGIAVRMAIFYLLSLEGGISNEVIN